MTTSAKIPIPRDHRHLANSLINDAQRALANLTENVRNLDPDARDAINSARDHISIAETIIANQP